MRDALLCPDPLLSANIYASGLLNDLLSDAIVPFRRDLDTLSAPAYLWVVRYSRGGQHLKLRIHTAEDKREAIKKALSLRTQEYFAKVCNVPAAEPRISRPKQPAIDVEDESAVEFPDRSLVWTTYRRSHVTLGAKPWLADDSFVILAEKSLAGGCELLLNATQAGALKEDSDRLQFLSKSLLSALPAVGFMAPQAVSYLQYHRDWLLRFFVAETAKEQQLLGQFDRQARPETLERLRSIFDRNCLALPTGAWVETLAELAAYTAGFRGHTEYSLDPFTDDVTFPPLFKVLHGTANQIGVAPLQEAYVHHLLLAALRIPDIKLETAAVSGGQNP